MLDGTTHAIKYAPLRKRSAEDGSLEDLLGGHMSTPHTLLDKDVEGQDEDEELSRRKVREIERKEGLVFLVTDALALHHWYTESRPVTLKSPLLREPRRI